MAKKIGSHLVRRDPSKSSILRQYRSKLMRLELCFKGRQQIFSVSEDWMKRLDKEPRNTKIS